MALPGLATDRVRTERTPTVVWVVSLIGPVAIPLLWPVLWSITGLASLLGWTLGIILLVLLFAGSLAHSLFSLNKLRPKAIRVTPTGVEVERMFGESILAPWSNVSVTFGRPRGFGVLLYAGPPGGFVILSPQQYDAVRSSPFLVMPTPSTAV